MAGDCENAVRKFGIILIGTFDQAALQDMLRGYIQWDYRRARRAKNLLPSPAAGLAAGHDR